MTTLATRVRAVALIGVIGLIGVGGSAPLAGQESLDMAVQILAEGRLDDGRQALVEAAMALPPAEATRVLRMAQTLGALHQGVQPAAARAIVLAHRGSLTAAIATLTDAVEGADRAEPGQGAALLLLAARLAETADRQEQAEGLYARVVAGHRESVAWPEAVLELSERRLADERDMELAATDLEDLIVERPTHPLVPTARLVLERLQEAIG